jgi:branched-chain amino acid transport system ATP-binding protein
MTILTAGKHEERAADPGSLVLELRDIVVRFGGVVGLDRVSLTVQEGEVCGLIGPNGAGKTTLFDVVSGLRSPNRGVVHLDGNDVSRASSAARAQKGVRRTFQRVQTFGWLSVEDNLLAAMEWHGGGGGVAADLLALPPRRRIERRRRARVEEVMELCGLTELRSRSAGSLPVGSARMVELGRAIVDPPRLLLLDEPTSGLEEAEVARLSSLLRTLLNDVRCAVLLVEHDIRFVMAESDRIVVLDQGRVLCSGTPEEIRTSELVQAAYLGDLAGIHQTALTTNQEEES